MQWGIPFLKMLLIIDPTLTSQTIPSHKDPSHSLHSRPLSFRCPRPAIQQNRARRWTRRCRPIYHSRCRILVRSDGRSIVSSHPFCNPGIALSTAIVVIYLNHPLISSFSPHNCHDLSVFVVHSYSSSITTLRQPY